MSRSTPRPVYYLASQMLGGAFRGVALLSKGGFGDVLRARRLGEDGLAKGVALKMLHSSMNHTPQFVDHLKNDDVFADLGSGSPEALGLSITLSAGERLTLRCKATTASCSILRDTPDSESPWR